MGFAGELTTIGLPEVFRNVAFSRLTGVLRLHGDGHDAAIYFEHGAIRALNGGEALLFDYETLAERAGAAPAEAIHEVRSRPRRRTLREALLETDRFLEESYVDAVSAAVREELVVLFGATHASFVFEEGLPERGLFDAEQLGCNLSIDPESLAADAARHHDEWHHLNTRIGSEDRIFVASAGADGRSPEETALLERLDGTRDLRGAIRGLPYQRIDLLRAAAQLIDGGTVTPASTDQMRVLAEEAEAASEINRAACLLASAIEHAPDDLDLHRERVALFERAERLTDAAAASKQLGEVYERVGDVKSAVTAYEQVVRIAPHDTDALRRIVDLHDARGDTRSFLTAGRQLAEAHSAQGQHEAARDVLQELLARDPTNIGLREATAATYIKMHEPQNAAQELLSLAESASAANGYHRALHYYRSVLAVDRSCNVAAARIAELESSRVKRRKHLRRRRRICALVALVLGLALWQGAREVLAQEALHRVARATSGSDPVTVIAHYADVCHSFPLTRGAAFAEEMVRAWLLDELRRIRSQHDLDALRRLGEIEYPEPLNDLWRDARDEIRARASAWAER